MYTNSFILLTERDFGRGTVLRVPGYGFRTSPRRGLRHDDGESVQR